MNFLEKLKALVALQIHAVFLTLSGVGLSIAGHKDEAMLLLGAAAAMFKGQHD